MPRMAGRVVLHVGTMKSGTSYLQARLFANRDVLLDRGVALPTTGWAMMVAAVNDVLRRDSDRALWNQVAEAVRAYDGTSVISMEYLGPARPKARRRVLDAFAGKDVQVVVTARDLNRQIPATWQERVQNGTTASLREYGDVVRATRRSAPSNGAEHPHAALGTAFWRHQSLDRLVGNWIKEVG